MVNTGFSGACPRCQGYMYANRDQYGEYRECLQCGFMADIAEASEGNEARPSWPKSEVA